MITLILSNLITVTDYQKYLAVITLLIDIVSSIILLWRVIKSRKISCLVLLIAYPKMP